jgi:hypothetical protein
VGACQRPGRFRPSQVQGAGTAPGWAASESFVLRRLRPGSSQLNSASSLVVQFRFRSAGSTVGRDIRYGRTGPSPGPGPWVTPPARQRLPGRVRSGGGPRREGAAAAYVGSWVNRLPVASTRATGCANPASGLWPLHHGIVAWMAPGGRPSWYSYTESHGRTLQVGGAVCPDDPLRGLRQRSRRASLPRLIGPVQGPRRPTC